MLKGRGAQIHTNNKFLQNTYDKFHIEGIDCFELENPKTTFIPTPAKTLVHKVESPDVGMVYSANPYQGCEHGCIYCYARNSHEYWDYDAGLDFETKILIKNNAPLLFKTFISKKNWDFTPIHLSGNTDCYQPAERKFKLTRQILELALKYNQPVSIITKNSLILRDLDILKKLAEKNLINVVVSLTSLNEETRKNIEPRTVTAIQRLRIIEILAENNIPVGVNIAPIIPGLTDHEIPKLLEVASIHGAKWANYIILRLNGKIGDIFYNWLETKYVDRKDKIWNAIKSCHDGNVNNSIFGQRMKGSGKIAEIINTNFKLHCRKFNLSNTPPALQTNHKIDIKKTQLSLF